jgi:hypothetical protein
MYPSAMRSIEDAYDIIRRYSLDRVDFGGGSAEGFAAWLFVPGQDLSDVRVVAEQLGDYKRELARRARLGENLDEALLGDATSLVATLNDRTQCRRALAEFIRSVKFGPDGGRLWAAIAELATTPDSARQRPNDAGVMPQPRLNAAMRGLREFEHAFGDSLSMHYTPGESGDLDLMVRMDIERFDISLGEAPPWSGKEDDRWIEMCALLRMATRDVMSVEDQAIAKLMAMN